MKLAVPFRVFAITHQVNSEEVCTASVILHPRPEHDDPYSATRALWRDFPAGELTLKFIDPQMIEQLHPGQIVRVVLEIA